MSEVTIQAADGGSFMGYLARPSAAPAAGIVVIQEIFGVNAVMRSICDDLASQGYLALCPDLFWRQEPGIQLTDQSDAEWARAFELFGGFDTDKGMADLQATASHLRGMEECSGRVGAVGYCLGGKLAYLMATRTDVDCSVGYYGVMIPDHLDEASNITKPLMLHIAGKDEYVSAEAQGQIHAALNGHKRVTLHDYPDRDHAFARVGGKHYDARDAEAANGRTAAFFQSHLS